MQALSIDVLSFIIGLPLEVDVLHQILEEVNQMQCIALDSCVRILESDVVHRSLVAFLHFVQE